VKIFEQVTNMQLSIQNNYGCIIHIKAESLVHFKLLCVKSIGEYSLTFQESFCTYRKFLLKKQVFNLFSVP